MKISIAIFFFAGLASIDNQPWDFPRTVDSYKCGAKYCYDTILDCKDGQFELTQTWCKCSIRYKIDIDQNAIKQIEELERQTHKKWYKFFDWSNWELEIDKNAYKNWFLAIDDNKNIIKMHIAPCGGEPEVLGGIAGASPFIDEKRGIYPNAIGAIPITITMPMQSPTANSAMYMAMNVLQDHRYRLLSSKTKRVREIIKDKNFYGYQPIIDQFTKVPDITERLLSRMRKQYFKEDLCSAELPILANILSLPIDFFKKD